IPAKAEIQGQPRSYLPVVLTVEAKLFGRDQEVGVAIRIGHTSYSASAREAVGKNRGPTTCRRVYSENAAWIRYEIHLQGRVELEESALDRVIDIVNTALKGVLAPSLGEVVFKLPFALERLLRHVAVGSERSIREGYERSLGVACNQVVPV